MEISFNQKHPPSVTEVPTSARQCTYEHRGITALPRELVEKILANLDGKDLVVCKRVTQSWKKIVDSTPMLSQAFYRRMRPPVPVGGLPATINSYYCANYWPSMRHWLENFSEPGRELVLEFDQLVRRQARLIPERLFFSLAQLLAETPVLHCRKVCTITHANWISKAGFSPDGRYVITASVDNTAKICQRRINGQWQEVTTLAHSDTVMHAYFSPTGEYCLTVCWDHTIRIWERGQVGEQWQNHMTPLDSVFLHTPSFSANGNYLVILLTWRTTQIYQLIDGQWQRQTTLLEGYTVREALFHPRDNILATVHCHVNVCIWQLVDNQWSQQAVLKHPDFVPHICFSPDGNRLLATSEPDRKKDQCITNAYIYSRAGRAWLKEAVIPLADIVYITRFSPNGDKLVTISHQRNIITIWQFVGTLWHEVILPQANNFTNARFSPDSDRLVTTRKDNTVILWREVEGQWQEEATLGCAHWIADAQFSPHGHHLVTIPENGDAKIWGIVDGVWQEKSCPSLGKIRPGSFFSPDGLYFLSVSGVHNKQQNTTHIWTFRPGEP